MAGSELDATVYCALCGKRMVDGACNEPYCSISSIRRSQGPAGFRDGDSGGRPGPGWWMALALVGLVATVAAGLTLVGQSRTDRMLADYRAVVDDDAARQEALSQQLHDLAATNKTLRRGLGQLRARLDSAPDDSAVARIASRSVVTVLTAAGSGSGFAVTHESGRTLLVTNFHVVADDYLAGRRSVTVTRKASSWPGRVIEVSQANDLAVISVHRRLPVLPIADGRPAVGASLLVLGSPLGLGGTVTSGIVSAYRQDFDLDYLQFSAPISPGNSGGPVIDEQGRVVGVAVAKMIGQGAEGLSFAIPTSRLCVALSVC